MSPIGSLKGRHIFSLFIPRNAACTKQLIGTFSDKRHLGTRVLGLERGCRQPRHGLVVPLQPIFDGLYYIPYLHTQALCLWFIITSGDGLHRSVHVH